MHSDASLEWLDQPVAPIDSRAAEAARQRQAQLTKPPGSLGRLETLAEQFAGWQGQVRPALERIRLCVFAADHGIAARGVSAFPQAVTAQMVNNFCRGGAAVSVLGERCDADFRVINLGCVVPPQPHPRLIDRTLNQAAGQQGTADFSEAAAMTEEQLSLALAAGREQVDDEQTIQLFIGGEMGIGNTTSASALAAALLGLDAGRVVGRGTGIDGETLERKRELIDYALALHRVNTTQPLQALRCLGGFEIAALVGAYVRCAQRGIPVLVDGFISTAAALVACRLCPPVRSWLLFAHQSTEPGHRLMLKFLEAQPLLSLEMRLGEGSGAALAVPLLQSALALHSQMATFSEAGVSDA
ncbi:nicotinate-nucleotide--dimethylbenzimidazole phosphoribosyltransferase [Marinimicrobium sp. C2-29]|uniref:nicotinate-nucleotide--dimethylbenzimidazole phosphoribosyltransferase n=1 Tax=Marinimicrobium sp. C2-29 TaxID=3139825 RepID=UPI00313A3356